MTKGPDFPRPALHHVTLKTCRLEAMIAWYATVIGITVQHKSAVGAWMTNDAANHRVALLTSSRLSDDGDKLTHSGMHHLAFEYGSYDDLLGTYLRLSVQGIEPHACLDHGMTMSLYYVDPDGNSVELQADNFGDWAVSSEYMRSSPDFERNPIGMPFDPGKMAAAWKAGATKAELHARAYGGEFAPASPLDLRFPGD
jgi:catechol 2,3-dioxygenase